MLPHAVPHCDLCPYKQSDLPLSTYYGQMSIQLCAESQAGTEAWGQRALLGQLDIQVGHKTAFENHGTPRLVKYAAEGCQGS